MTTLDTLPINSSCRVSHLKTDGFLYQRFVDLGIVPGTEIKALFSSPAGNPRAYSVRGATIALRNTDASRIAINI